MQRHFPAALLRIECFGEPASSHASLLCLLCVRPSKRPRSSDEIALGGRVNRLRTPGRTDAGHDGGDTRPRALRTFPVLPSSWPFLALPAADEGP
jgi:hypothetical protein